MLEATARAASALTLATALAAGCGHGAPSDDRFQPAVTVAAAAVEDVAAESMAPPPAEPATSSLGQPLGNFQLTYYYVAAESDEAEPASGESDTAAAAPAPANDNIPLYHRKSCDQPLAEVSPAFYKKLKMQGTGKLRDGRTINISGPCTCSKRPCFFVVQSQKSWGVGVNKRPLSPFRSVAVDTSVVAIGTLMYLPELDGLTMPGKAPWGGFVHDGCVIADDRGGNIDGKQLDFFVGHRGAYNGLSKRHNIKRVTVYDGAGRCERKDGKVVRVHRNST